MKTKNWYRTIAALGALVVLFGCEQWAAKTADGTEVEEAAPQFTEDGRPLINLNIGYGGGTTGQSRALSANLAKTFNFVEVTFTDGTTYYAKSAHKSNPLKIAIPAGNYDGETGNGDAVMLVGYYNGGNYILLATGKISIPNDQVITAATTEIKFTLRPLEFDYIGDQTQVAFTAPSGVELREITSESYAGLQYFNIPTDSAGPIAMAVTISSNSDAATKHLVSATAPSAVLHIEPWNLLDLPIPIAGSNPLTAPTLSSDFTTNDDKIILTVGASYTIGDTGLAAIFFDVPVVGFENGAGAITWHIQTGLSNAVLDEGGESSGGAILLEIGTTGLTTYDVSGD